MPLLRKEPEISSEELFELEPASHPWWVAHVRSRAEKVLARHLAGADIPFYLPQTERRSRRAGRVFKSYLPLFSGYVFYRGGQAAREAVWRSGLEPRLIEVTDQARLNDELRQIRELQRAGANLEPLDDVVPGDPVRIVDGAFRGYTGVALHERGHDRLIVSLSLLQKQLAVEFDKSVLTKAGRA